MEKEQQLNNKLDSLIDLNLKNKTIGENWFTMSISNYLKTGRVDDTFRNVIKHIAKEFAKEVINIIPELEENNCPNCGYNSKTHVEDLTPKNGTKNNYNYVID